MGGPTLLAVRSGSEIVPLISVIMAAYNAAEHVEEAAKSILAQTVSDFEFIIIDDGSTDDTAAILEQLQKEVSRIRLFRQANAGLTRALNTGLAQVRGEYIA